MLQFELEGTRRRFILIIRRCSYRLQEKYVLDYPVESILIIENKSTHVLNIHVYMYLFILLNLHNNKTPITNFIRRGIWLPLTMRRVLCCIARIILK